MFFSWFANGKKKMVIYLKYQRVTSVFFNLKNKRLNKVLYFQLVISISFTHCIDLDPFYPLKRNKISRLCCFLLPSAGKKIL
ncbi:Uncharacterised protein [Salmonella enterica subsp. enterica]|nr:Uncharacterised protein [Salmonella enterica subsp. enterica]